jgi:hypothetical protein
MITGFVLPRSFKAAAYADRNNATEVAANCQHLLSILSEAVHRQQQEHAQERDENGVNGQKRVRVEQRRPAG